ncbi:glycosyltransferase family 2 protein [Salegentibacter mishustinae]|uniref:glycosyltransferase family 2 protein n=1 Tax=Salegentibacter mishustinae TaxID=270918 RepID=UPI001CE0CB2F|nr:glycosyltransferase family A protein [Salegentibacter mishustinae]UBZ07454.1 glycosyltransferase family 2 protein [Salegentibacter mishustinae]
MISIIIPCYNTSQFVQQAVDSAKAQTGVKTEIIVVDDGSNRETKVILAKIDGIILITQKNLGQSAARNAGIKKASGKYIFILDSDDYVEPIFCERALGILETKEDVKIVSSYTRRFIEDRTLDIFKPKGGKLSDFLLENYAIGGAYCARKDELFIAGLYDENMKQGFEDWEFFIRLLRLNGSAYIIPEVLFHYRKHHNSTSVNANQIKYELQKYIYYKHQDLYKQHFEVFIEHLLGKIEREEREKIKHTQRMEFRLGRAFLNPLRKIKRMFK